MNSTTESVTQESAQLEKLRTQISTDIDALHQQEASLRDYEQRLRQLVGQAHLPMLPVAGAGAPFAPAGPSQAELDAEWEKYNRSHALLEAARRSLCDDRLALKEREERMQVRESEVARREAWVKVRERELEAEVAAKAAIVVEREAKPSFTTAPFLAARNLLMSRKN